ncbi:MULTISPECIES: hypothetical protein [unclassified Haloferax]|uniref:DUF7260 family protein n=1 Tax=unclassified Haloferax TaxID=2625095 RepID=UPI0002AF92D4|nr:MULTISPECIES: hypothetical protein [unclassified Haloferax]ELZ59444.1 hypothetical protein C460_06358 [Haloferax sp. ATCC BAA-646]ELZ64717.1 hypothetical protein C459_09320 [Haloferax sp. ATCC BAA-645]ELZ69449.1 hypothetical protein C458_04174 [Haloferax sp. ATCC BAA-644]
MAVSLGRLDDAREALRAERRRCVDEREAFRSFRREVAASQATASTPNQTPAAATLVGQRGGRGGTDAALSGLRRSYERTVMSVPHYDEEYGDDFGESFAAEFGPDVATAFRSASVLSAPLRRTIAAAAASSLDERGQFIDIVDEEAESVASMRGDIEDLLGRLDDLDRTPLSDRGFDALLALYGELSALRERLDGLVAARQETISHHRRTLSGLVPDVTEFFYADLSVRYPVLATFAAVGATLATATRRVERHLAATP